MINTYEIEHYLDNISSSFYRLIVIIGKQGAGKTELIGKLGLKLSWPQLNINLMLAESLMAYTSQKRPTVVAQLFYDLFNPMNTGYLVDNTELLFDKRLKVNPLSLLKNASRNQTIICTLNGRMDNLDFIFAETNHPEYFRETLSGIFIVDLNNIEQY